ncbi:hypothetical protein SEA_CRACKLEWINK_88 [Mycobacterium phage Cracklewink]|nr:hypothetical protein SEA_CRACKLEWINK_88 [Mycobacterium phage Cracklewink]
MTARIINQRTGTLIAEFPDYLTAAEHRRDVLRPQLQPNEPCPFAIRCQEAEA